MNKKLLTAILLFVVLLLGSVSCYANTANNLGTEIQNSANKTQTTIQNAGQGIKNVASDIGNGVQHAVQGIGNGMQDGLNTTNNKDGIGVSTGNYATARTSTDKITGTTMTNTAWIWLILGIVGVVIVALTWYYVSQNNERH